MIKYFAPILAVLLLATLYPANAQVDSCIVCQIIVGYVEDAIEEDNTAEEIIEIVYGICEQVPSYIQDPCYEFVILLVEVVDVIQDGGSAKEICRELNACQDKRSAVEAPKKRILTKLPEKVAEVPAKVVAIPEQDQQDIQCYACLSILNLVKDELGNNETAANVNEVLHQICEEIPSLLSPACHDLIDEYYPKLLALLMKDESAEQICAAIDLCQNFLQSELGRISYLAYVPKADENNALLPVEKVKEGINMACTGCKVITGWIESEEGQNVTKQEVDDLLHEVCDFVPSFFAEECHQLVSKYSDILIDLLLSHITPSEICEEIGLCEPSFNIIALHFLDNVDSQLSEEDKTCVSCQSAVDLTKSVLEKFGQDEEALKSLRLYAEKISCPVMRNAFIHVLEELPIAFEILESIPSSQICGALNMCKSQRERNTYLFAKNYIAEHEESMRVSSSTECQSCQWIVSAMESYLSEDSTDVALVSLLQQLCTLLPQDYIDVCGNFVSVYTEEIIYYIIGTFPPPVVCERINFCKNDDF
eukprot:TRINITY_DN2551_c0_g1_i1.p1 TRINITY_DN2551_c0_g1~~TRINITY_DN2551_c0_g1_i1.p1  ORF type:complete len:535 (-),score=133.58 TRINITY_DN2551_c0_g1_i1:32-1636(-)